MTNKISISYSEELEAIYVQVAPEDTKVDSTTTRKLGSRTINVDFDDEGEVVGVEIL